MKILLLFLFMLNSILAGFNLMGPRPEPQNTVIQTQNAFHYDEDLTNQIVDRNKRSFMISSIERVISDLEKRVDIIQTGFEDKMNKIQNAIESE